MKEKYEKMIELYSNFVNTVKKENSPCEKIRKEIELLQKNLEETGFDTLVIKDESIKKLIKNISYLGQFLDPYDTLSYEKTKEEEQKEVEKVLNSMSANIESFKSKNQEQSITTIPEVIVVQQLNQSKTSVGQSLKQSFGSLLKLFDFSSIKCEMDFTRIPHPKNRYGMFESKKEVTDFSFLIELKQIIKKVEKTAKQGLVEINEKSHEELVELLSKTEQDLQELFEQLNSVFKKDSTNGLSQKLKQEIENDVGELKAFFSSTNLKLLTKEESKEHLIEKITNRVKGLTEDKVKSINLEIEKLKPTESISNKINY